MNSIQHMLHSSSIPTRPSEREYIRVSTIELTTTPKYEEKEGISQRTIGHEDEVTQQETGEHNLDNESLSKREEGIESFPLITNNEKSGVPLFGYDMSHLNQRIQFSAFCLGLFVFTIIYGCLQELITVKILNRHLGLFLTTAQFAGYAFWSFILSLIDRKSSSQDGTMFSARVPAHVYIRLALLRAVDVGMTNVSMQYLNYPARVLIKSSRVAFTMVTGTMFGKRYSLLEYFIVCTMVCGLVIFLHADARSAVFHPIGVAILVISLICDGVINNWSEATMSKYRVGHNEFLLHLYSIAFLSMTTFTYFNGELLTGIHFLSVPGTYSEARAGHPSGCTPFFKVMALVLLTTTGLFGSSCAAGITKYFGALAMSITSTARKAVTLFLSFMLFHNTCNTEHIVGMIIFLSSLCTKSFMLIHKDRTHAKTHSIAEPL